ncbi:GGDEF domain-containing protein [bacterium]|nr:MAG: GGDEF domain-containing protein [bacterium]
MPSDTRSSQARCCSLVEDDRASIIAGWDRWIQAGGVPYAEADPARIEAAYTRIACQERVESVARAVLDGLQKGFSAEVAAYIGADGRTWRIERDGIIRSGDPPRVPCGDEAMGRTDDLSAPFDDGRLWYVVLPLRHTGFDEGWIYAAGQRLVDVGRLRGLAAFVTSVAQSVRLRAEAEQRALTDPLTQLPNRLGLEAAARKWLAHAEPFIVGFGDVDNFKAVNDTKGHDEGDRVLVRIGQVLTSVVREGDVAARLHGDEFVCLARGTSAEAFLARLNRALEAAYLQMSWAAAVYPADGRSWDALKVVADARMYAVKRARKAGR